jgi:hypothetical protein
MLRFRHSFLPAAALALLSACAGDPPAAPQRLSQAPEADRLPAPSVEASPELTAPALPPGVEPRPDWLGTRPLPLRPDGFGEIQPTPPDLADRRLLTPDHLPAPASDAFASSIGPVPPDVVARSTWTEGCPVALEDLRYVTVAHWGFDERPHTGELLLHESVADDVVGVFSQLHGARFPIEELRITTMAELDAHPTGDGNNSGGYVCRASRGSSEWSEHAAGLAVDLNPFHNPYAKGDVVLPELASAYVDRADHRPGMIQAGDVATTAFAGIGWEWGGNWRSAKDWMHFSKSGR